MTRPDDDSLLLGLSAPFYRHEGRLHVERQSLSGLAAWRANFDRVSAFSICHDAAPPAGWVPWTPEADELRGVTLVPLPDSYNLRTYLKSRRQIGQRLLELMQASRYRTFAYGGWIGDPGEIAASVARRHRLAHAVWFDRIESQVVAAEGQGRGRGRAALKARLRSAIIRRHEHHAVRHADLTLLHGATVFDTLRHRARNPHQVEDVHSCAADLLDPGGLRAKIDGARQGPLRLLYCGRAAPMKGPLDWIATLVRLKAQGMTFRARWLGDGELLGQMKTAAAEGGLTAEDLVFDGFVSDPAEVRRAYRDAQVMLFCHVTDESPRNLIESLHAGTPLVGYRDPYSAALVNEQGAGLLVARGDVAALAGALARLDADRAQLQDLIARAGRSALQLTRDAVFRHRSSIIRTELTATLTSHA